MDVSGNFVDQIEVFWIEMPCSVLGYHRFGGPCCRWRSSTWIITALKASKLANLYLL